MATKKKTGAASAALTSLAMQHGRDAYGARFVREGAALTPELDLAYALGRGSQFEAVTLLEDLEPGKKAKAGMPRNRAIHVAREGWEGTGTMEEAPLEVPPLGMDEAKSLAREAARHGSDRPEYYLTLEALVGPSALLASVVDGMEEASKSVWERGSSSDVCFAVYALMLRALPTETEAARSRLVALFESLEGKLGYPPHPLGKMLFGRSAIERYGYKYLTKFACFGTSPDDAPSTPHDLVFCPEDGPWVAAQHAALWKILNYRPKKWMLEPPMPRLVYIGGDALLETELAVVDKYPGTMQAAALAAYRDFRSPLATACIEKLSAPGSKVQKQAMECLAARA